MSLMISRSIHFRYIVRRENKSNTEIGWPRARFLEVQAYDASVFGGNSISSNLHVTTANKILDDDNPLISHPRTSEEDLLK